jgi:hypothetical protein
MAQGASFQLQLGVANATIGNISEGSSDVFSLIGDSFEKLVFNQTNVNFLGTGSTGFYKLIDLGSGFSETYKGLTFDEQTGLVSSGLTYTGLADGLFANFVVGTDFNGAALGDIHLQVVPEPNSVALVSAGIAILGSIRRRRVA